MSDCDEGDVPYVGRYCRGCGVWAPDAVDVTGIARLPQCPVCLSQWPINLVQRSPHDGFVPLYPDKVSVAQQFDKELRDRLNAKRDRKIYADPTGKGCMIGPTPVVELDVFIGNNELRLNAATMMQALQEYLDRRVIGTAPRVTALDHHVVGQDQIFVARLKSPGVAK